MMFMVDNLLGHGPTAVARPPFAERREQEAREADKLKEKERLEKERQERERLEKRAAEQAVHKHFEESLRLAQQRFATKRRVHLVKTIHDPQWNQIEGSNNMCWINSLPGGPREEKHGVEHHPAPPPPRLVAAPPRHDRAPAYYHHHGPLLNYHHEGGQRVSMSSKVEYPAPPAAHRSGSKQQAAEKPAPQPALPKAEPNFSLFNYSPYPNPMSFLHHEKKEVKPPAAKEPPPLLADLKNSVIVKNNKSPGLEKSGVVGPKYLGGSAKSPYEYRSPSASPHPPHPLHPPSPAPVHVHRSLTPQRHSPHQPVPHRQSQSPQYAKMATVTSYPYPSYAPPPPPGTPPKPRVSSPAPAPHYAKPRAVTVPAKPLTPSPYQGLAQHNLPPPQQPAAAAAAHATPPAAHQVRAYPPASAVVKREPGSQTQPLDLGMTRSESPASLPSPKRKAEEQEPCPEPKKPKAEEPEAPPPAVAAPPAVQERPETPIKTEVDSPARPVHKLKKAWLQRHSGEDTNTDTGDTKGGGTCVTLPMPVRTTTPPVPPKKPEVAPQPPAQPPVVNSLQCIGSMAVNSIKKPKGPRKSKELNGHVGPKPQDGDDSSSSDPERKTTPQKRIPPKVKRKKSGRKPIAEEAKRKKTGASSTDSEKESGSDKDSDSGSANGKKKEEKTKEGGKKRGRRPKSGGAAAASTASTGSKNGNEEESRNKKAKEEDPPAPERDPAQKPSVGQLKKTGESFLQDGPCFEVAPKLAKCRECRWTPNQRNRNMPNIFCRFYAFRRLRYTKNGQLAIAGFSDPHRDALQEDLKLWLPSPDSSARLDPEMSRFLLAQLGDQFCDLLQQEKEATSIHMSEDKTIAWKRVVQFVREMCDVCETTLFNFHWACGKCGFVVCIDCYKGRKNGTVKMWGEAGRDRDDLSWLLCTNRQPHEQEKLMLTQIIAGDSLAAMGRRVHDSRALYGIPMYCGCPLAQETPQPPQQPNGIAKDLLKSLTRKAEVVNGNEVKVKEETKTEDNNSLSWLADVALSNEDKKNCEDSVSSSDSDEDDKEGNYSTLRELLIRPSGNKSNGSRAPSPGSGAPAPAATPAPVPAPPPAAKKKSQLETLDEVISSVIEQSVGKDEALELKHFVRRYSRQGKGREPLPIRIMTLTESKQLYPDVPHAWLCDGKLLRLLDSTNPSNYRVFQDQWKRGQPVMVSDVTKNLDSELWNPESFLRDFGDTKNDLVNCATGNLVPNQPMRRFWEGFLTLGKRLKDDKGSPMILKLKDWPPGDDFAEMLPSRYCDLMKVLPLGEYTMRCGRLNLASRLPDCFVRPDLGPKMYTAYGSAALPSKGTTNLHLDISDAVNVMVHVGIPNDVDHDACIKEALRAIDEAGCDVLTRRRVREKGQLPGALWHIYMARDADKIRDLLNKVALERGARLEPHHDPIHDQSWYLDNSLRERLYKEYAVEGFSIVQCLGDAVFVPAGAPHQVRNLHNCVKVAEDFVSPENIAHCFNLTQEFRDLSDTHTNHEDKLQIKNIVYHAVKDSLSSLATEAQS